MFVDSVNFMLDQYPNLQIVIPTLPDLEIDVIEAVRDINVDPVIILDQREKWDAMRSCNMAMAVSGTVGLELAYMNIPHIIAYKTHIVTFLIVRLLVQVHFAHLVNILLEKRVVPEFLQGKCKSILIAAELIRLLKDDALMAQQRVAFHDARKILKKGTQCNPSDTAARYVLSLL